MTSDDLASAKPKPPAKPKLLGIFLVFVMTAIVGSIVVYSLSGWGVPARVKNLKNPFLPTPEATQSARAEYAARCQSCHGANGDGRGERAERLSIAPADFRDAHAMGLRTDGELFWIVTEGHKPMPAFRGTMNEEQRWNMVEYVRGFASHK
jgi:Cytochrome C oxidase, cbb3-type, subunit III